MTVYYKKQHLIDKLNKELYIMPYVIISIMTEYTYDPKITSHHISGWIPLKYTFGHIVCGNEKINNDKFKQKITDENRIELYYDDRFNYKDYEEEDKKLAEKLKRPKICESEGGFFMDDIMDLCLESYKDLRKMFGKDSLDNLALTGFDFNYNELSVHPNTDS